MATTAMKVNAMMIIPVVNINLDNGAFDSDFKYVYETKSV